MGAEVSRAAGADEESAKRKHTAVEPRPDGKKKRRVSVAVDRRKSTGRNERKSLLETDIDRSGLTAFHEDIDADLPEDTRLAKLYDEAFGHAVRQLSGATGEGATKAQLKHVQAAFSAWHNGVTKAGGWHGATESRTLRPNPKNVELKGTLAKHHAAKRRLADEAAAWRAVYADMPPSVGAPASGAEAVAASAAPGTGPEPPAAVAGIADDSHLDLQIEVLENFVDKCNRILDAAEQCKTAVTNSITATRFQSYPAMNDPRALIAAVGSS
mmetsp:Transcript_25068/g.65370  ORF Transcript_25068/g.65370 Transcript_25068/m.65370 type:complete len:270 (-) Transcript_25068:177-986(-)